MSNSRKRTVTLTNANWQFCDRLVNRSNHFESVDEIVNYLLNSLAVPSDVNYALKVHGDASKMHESALEVHGDASKNPFEPIEMEVKREPDSNWLDEVGLDDI